jgi:hypothetical protein
VILDLKEAAAFLKCNPEVLRRNLDIWGVPHVRMGKKYRFTESGLLAYCNRQAPKEEQCLTGGKVVPSFTFVSREYGNLLGRIVTKTQKRSKTD